MKFDLSKLFELSARTSGAVSIACIILLFFPSSLLSFNIVDFRKDNGIWVFVVFVVAVSIWLSYLITWLSKIVMKKIKTKKTWDNYKYILKNLSKSEKLFLKEYYDKRETAVFIDLQNPVHKKLQTFNVISISAGTSLGTRFSMPGFIQPWVFKLIDKHPSYIQTKQ